MFEITTVKAQRLKLGLTQHKLAKLAGVSQSLLAKLEAGRIDPAYSSVRKIEQALQAATGAQEPIARDLMVRKVCVASPGDDARSVALLLRKHAISQVPVIKDGCVLGMVTESGLLDEDRLDNKAAKDVMSPAPPQLPEDARRSLIISLLHQYPCVLVQKDGKLAGLITKADVVKALI